MVCRQKHDGKKDPKPAGVGEGERDLGPGLIFVCGGQKRDGKKDPRGHCEMKIRSSLGPTFVCGTQKLDGKKDPKAAYVGKAESSLGPTFVWDT